MTDIAALKIANARRWLAAKRSRDFSVVARRLIATAARARYQAVQQATGVPWWAIAVIHEREASQNFSTQLGQGDPLNEVSRHVPAGRGPFSTWESGAFDALVNCAPKAALWKDWSAGGAMTILEEYNGLGYAARGLPSPYIWSGTDQYHQGKFVADGKFDPDVVDQQLGCAGLLMAMMELDRTITFSGSVVQPQPVPASKPIPAPPTAPAPAQGNWLANLIAAILSIFKRK